MSDIRERVMSCFCSLFPTLSREALQKSSLEAIPDWDSLSGVVLLAMIQQEFHISMEPIDLEHLGSIQSVIEHIAAHAIADADET